MYISGTLSLYFSAEQKQKNCCVYTRSFFERIILKYFSQIVGKADVFTVTLVMVMLNIIIHIESVYKYAT